MQKQKKPTPAQLAQTPQFEKQVEKQTPLIKADNKAERTILNFTKIPEHLLALLLKGPQNFTDLNDPDVKKKLEEGINSSDKKDATIADIRRQLDWLRREEGEAKQYFQQKEQQEKQAEAQEAKQKAEDQKKQQQQPPLESTTKQKRGMLFGGKKRKKTAETAAAFGKQ